MLVSGQTSLEEAARLMMEKQQDRIFVLDKEEKLIGVVSAIDIVRKIIELLS
jgi:CBS domain-containing protein